MNTQVTYKTSPYYMILEDVNNRHRNLIGDLIMLTNCVRNGEALGEINADIDLLVVPLNTYFKEKIEKLDKRLQKTYGIDK